MFKFNISLQHIIFCSFNGKDSRGSVLGFQQGRQRGAEERSSEQRACKEHKWLLKNASKDSSAAVRYKSIRELTREPWEKSQRRLLVKEGDNCVRIGEGWKKNTKALRGEKATCSEELKS